MVAQCKFHCSSVSSRDQYMLNVENKRSCRIGMVLKHITYIEFGNETIVQIQSYFIAIFLRWI
jgi:hypothetical protein